MKAEIISYVSFDLKPKCLRCVTKTKELAMPFQYFWSGLEKQNAVCCHEFISDENMAAPALLLVP